jgi:hypothetical protein
MILLNRRVLILGGAVLALMFFPFLDETTKLDIENNLYLFLHLPLTTPSSSLPMTVPSS